MGSRRTSEVLAGDVQEASRPERKTRVWMRRYRAHLRQRFQRTLDRRREDPLPAALRATRPLVFAEALVLLMIGFSLDDLHVLRVPGFVAGAIAALAVLVFGGLLHGASWAARLSGMTPTRIDAALERRRMLGRIALTIVTFGFVAWLVLFSSGVPSWAA